jgi:hypothetical protein
MCIYMYIFIYIYISAWRVSKLGKITITSKIDQKRDYLQYIFFNKLVYITTGRRKQSNCHLLSQQNKFFICTVYFIKKLTGLVSCYILSQYFLITELNL